MCIWYCFFFKQMTAYELRISDLSSDVFSSDLPAPRLIDADKRQQFAHEIAGARKTYRSHGKEQEKHGITRHIDRKTAITADLTGVQSIRSEEHTSELQSLMRISYAVFFLKKNKRQPTDTTERISARQATTSPH